MKKYFNYKNSGFIYSCFTFLLYFEIYFALSFNIAALPAFVTGAFFFALIFIFDFYFFDKKVRIFIRFILFVLFYVFLKYFISVLSIIISPQFGYNVITDKLPFIFERDTVLAVILLIFYYLFDSYKSDKIGIVRHYLSSIFVIFSSVMILRNEDLMVKTIFKNNFILSFYVMSVLLLVFSRHFIFFLITNNKDVNKRYLYFMMPLIIILISVLFGVALPEHLKKEKSNMYNQGLFMFDFSKFLKLSEELKLNDERVLIMELDGYEEKIINKIEKGWDRQIYLKRFSLEEYDLKSGFKLSENIIDPESPPFYIAGSKWILKKVPFYKERKEIIQTLYLINIDSSSLMGSTLLKKVIPMTGWDGSKYKAIYKGVSDIFYPEKVLNDLSVQDAFLENIAPERKNILLDYGADKDIKELAVHVTSSGDTPLMKTIAVEEYLRNNFYYTLKPGFAKDNDQIKYFLFDSKKGYCSYFAFAMTLMLRSIGIASRVAVGFAPDMNEKTLNFYDVRSLHGHAWVEVFFDDYGWLTFDPTTDRFLPDEKYSSFKGDKDDRNKLIEDILKNKDKMQEINNEENKVKSIFENIKGALKNSVRTAGVIFILFFLSVIFFSVLIRKNFYFIKYYFTSDNKRKYIFLYKHFLTTLLGYGIAIRKNETVFEFSERMYNSHQIDIKKMTAVFQNIIFSDKEKFDISKDDLKTERVNFRKAVNKNLSGQKVKAFFNLSAFWKKILPVIFFVFFVLSDNAYTEDLSGHYIIDFQEAIEGGFFDKALKIADVAEKKHPDDYIPNYLKGTLFFENRLFENAVIQFLKAKSKGFVSEENYFYLAESYGSLGQDEKALKIYKEAFSELYPSKSMYEKLGWLYFKTRDLDEGIALVNRGLKAYPESPGLFMLLGTLYSSAYNYNESKKNYLLAIEKSFLEYESESFRSIVYYNLSLLEKSFLNYESAYDSITASFSWRERSSAHNQLNIIYQDSLELNKAFSEIQKAIELPPDTKFPYMSLVNIYILSGKISSAKKLTMELLGETDFSWMVYFGVSKDEYFAELYRFLFYIYETEANLLNYQSGAGLNFFTRPFKKIYFKLSAFYYNFKSSTLFIKTGENSYKKGNTLDGLEQLYNGYEKTNFRKAYKVLNISERFESKSIPAKQKIYNIKKAVIREKKELFFTKKMKARVLTENIVKLDIKWEKAIFADTLVEIIKSFKGKDQEVYINKLFLTHSPFIPMNNLLLQCSIIFKAADGIKADTGKIVSEFKKRGLIQKKDSEVKLDVFIGNQEKYHLYEIDVYFKDALIKKIRFKIDKSHKKYYEKAGEEIYNNLFVYELE